MRFSKIKKVSCPNQSDFYETYVKGSQPVILKNLSKNWPARDKWTFDFFKKEYGEMLDLYYKKRGWSKDGKVKK